MKTSALITDMNNPLGKMIGNALEVAESVQCLHGNGPSDLEDIVLKLGINIGLINSELQMFWCWLYILGIFRFNLIYLTFFLYITALSTFVQKKEFEKLLTNSYILCMMILYQNLI